MGIYTTRSLKSRRIPSPSLVYTERGSNSALSEVSCCNAGLGAFRRLLLSCIAMVRRPGGRRTGAGLVEATTVLSSLGRPRTPLGRDVALANARRRIPAARRRSPRGATTPSGPHPPHASSASGSRAPQRCRSRSTAAQRARAPLGKAVTSVPSRARRQRRHGRGRLPAGTRASRAPSRSPISFPGWASAVPTRLAAPAPCEA